MERVNFDNLRRLWIKQQNSHFTCPLVSLVMSFLSLYWENFEVIGGPGRQSVGKCSSAAQFASKKFVPTFFTHQLKWRKSGSHSMIQQKGDDWSFVSITKLYLFEWSVGNFLSYDQEIKLYQRHFDYNDIKCRIDKNYGLPFSIFGWVIEIKY